MPCQCDYPPEPTRPDPNLKRLKNLADRATRAGCEMKNIIRARAPGLLDVLTPETLQWILKHDEEDNKRLIAENAAKERENKKKKALKKLTVEERRILGL